MLVIKVELHSAVTGGVTELDRLTIANEGWDMEDRSIKPWTFTYWGRMQKENKTALVHKHPQRQADGSFTDVWILVAKMLKAMGYAEAPPLS